MKYTLRVTFEDSKKKPLLVAKLDRNEYGKYLKKLWASYILKTRKLEKNAEGDLMVFMTARKKGNDEFEWCGEGEAYPVGEGRWMRDYYEG